MARTKYTLSRRTALRAAGLAAGYGLLMEARAEENSQHTGTYNSNNPIKMYGSLKEAKEDNTLRPGEWLATQGYYSPGDGGAACYLTEKKEKTETDEGETIETKSNCIARLQTNGPVNYKMFGAKGDPQSDDGIQIKLAHDFANRNNLPVEVPAGEYWIRETRGVEIKTSVNWGQTVFHINEYHNTKEPTFIIKGKEAPIDLSSNETIKKAVVAQLKPGVQQIPELADYPNCLLWVRDNNDAIGHRYMENQSSKRKEEIVFVENDGRVLGDVAWTFKGLTELVAYPAENSYLVVEGGTFYLSGENHKNSREKLWYFHNGIMINRSRTIVRNQWVGVEKGRYDTSMNPRSGFYYFNNVYDTTLENVRLVPWQYDRPGDDNDLYAGTYGIGGNRLMKTTFRNVFAEGTYMHWGVFGTNMNKDFLVENCTLNRIDVHFHCWNLTIRGSRVGNKGIKVTGGGELIIEDTVCDDNHFLDFRRDYGAKWDGNISIRNCRLRPSRDWESSVVRSVAADFNYGYPIGMGRNIFVENFVVDYRAVPESAKACWLIRSSDFSQSKDGDRSFFPISIVFKNISVLSRSKGVKMIHIPDPGGFRLEKEGEFDGAVYRANAFLHFSNIDLDTEDDDYQLRVGDPKEGGATDGFSLFPKISIEDCKGLSVKVGAAPFALSVNNSGVSRVHGNGNKKLPGEMTFTGCRFVPVVQNKGETAYQPGTVLGTNFIHCTFHLPRKDGQTVEEPGALAGIMELNGKVLHNHLNSRLGNDVLAYLQKKKIALKREFVEGLRNGYDLEVG